MSDWRWLDAFKRGDDDLARELRAETDASLKRDPDRWTSKHVDETPPHVPKESGGGKGFRAREDRRGRSGKGDTERSHAGERTKWSDREWRRAQQDYQDKQERHSGWLRRDREERAERQREAEQELRDAREQARDDYRQGRPPPGYRGW